MSRDYYQKFEVKDGTQANSEDSRRVGPPAPPEIEAALADAQQVYREKSAPAKMTHSSSTSENAGKWVRSQAQQVKDSEFALVGPPPHHALVYRRVKPAVGKAPIWIGEKLTYDVTYLGLTAATLVLEALPCKSIGGRKVYDIQATVNSSSAFSIFYTLKDTVQSFIDTEGVFSHRFHMQLDETKQVRDSLELYDSENGEAFWWNRWDRKQKGYEEKKEFHPMEPFPQDSISSLYYLRFMPLPPGGAVKFVVESEAKPLDAVVTVVGRETLETPMGMLPTIKLKPQAATRGVLERKGNSYMWLTDDERRFLVRFEAQVKIGTIVVRLKSIELGTPPGHDPAHEKVPTPVESGPR